MRVLISSVVTLVFASSGAAFAGPAPDYSPDEFVRAILSGPAPCPADKTLEACEANPKTRRFNLPSAHHVSAPVASSAPAASSTAAPARPRRAVSSSDVLVTFATGSADITPQGKENLRSVAAGLMTAALAPIRFEIAGYTDASGKPEANADLSQRRAKAVKAFLVSLNVPESRLAPIGYGSEHLLHPDEPVSEGNRRVELHRLN